MRMDIIDALCGVWARILPIIRSRCSSHASFRAGVLGEYFSCYKRFLWIWKLVRCTAKNDNLDGDKNATPRSHNHTLAVLNAMPNAKDAWDHYGIISNIMVFHFLPDSRIAH